MSSINFSANFSLKNLNTFGLDIVSKKFIEVSDTQELKSVLHEISIIKEPLLILGGGSNILFTKNFEGIVLKNSILGLEVVNENDDFVDVKVGAGEQWHGFVLWCIKQGYGGVENLSLIPGTVGAAPMQNIGAYGVEIKDVFVSLEALNLETLKFESFNNSDCQFGYRQSIFKNIKKGKYIITDVTFKLSKNPVLNTSYGGIKNILDEHGVTDPSIKAVSDAVIEIRSSKLPDPNKIGNAGSFFKNPVIVRNIFEEIKNNYPDIPSYLLPEGLVKLPAAWLIENCGWKGKRRGEIGVHDKQALVLVNHGSGNGSDIYQLAVDIQTSVKDKFGIDLEMEVNVV
jgi:UDP-N-acetylmuramate dehydrogenase